MKLLLDRWNAARNDVGRESAILFAVACLCGVLVLAFDVGGGLILLAGAAAWTARLSAGDGPQLSPVRIHRRRSRDRR